MTELEIHKSFSEFILSVSGWRKVFELDGENGRSGLISEADAFLVFLACKSFEKFLLARGFDTVLIGRDTRPTGAMIVRIAEKAFTQLAVRVTGIAAAPEIMAHAAKSGVPFLYFSASHNPIGHNGLKFGLTNGGVLDETEAGELITLFSQAVAQYTPQFRPHDKTFHATLPLFTETECRHFTEAFSAVWQTISIKNGKANPVCEAALNANEKKEKATALEHYYRFTLETISGTADAQSQEAFCADLSEAIKRYKTAAGDFCFVYDLNGSSRSHSIDRALFERFGLETVFLNENEIVHGIIPEGENLQPAAAKMAELAAAGKRPLFALMPDCDGDRGNLVFWDSTQNRPIILNAQEVFALSVLSELSYVRAARLSDKPVAVAVNCATSFRIAKIANAFDAHVFTAEVGEANVVNLALHLQEEGYFVRILGEGSNGGNITFPAKVRDPLNTLFAILKLLVFPMPFRLWCECCGQPEKYRTDFTLQDIIATLPQYTTTATQEKRALLQIRENDQVKLKRAYQKIFEREWADKKDKLAQKYGFISYSVFGTKGTREFDCREDFGLSEKGGLKIVFYAADAQPCGFIWMRGSKTEPVFRVMADIKGDNKLAEVDLVEWQGAMLREADR